jgi:hypothetical protein
VCRLVTVVNDQTSDVGNPVEGVCEDDDVVFVVKNGKHKQEQRTNKAQPPKEQRNNNLLLLFRRIPLDQKPAGKHRVSGPPNDIPKNIPGCPVVTKKHAVVPE